MNSRVKHEGPTAAEAMGEESQLPAVWHLMALDALPQRLLVLAKMIERVTSRQLQGEFTIRDIHALLGKEGAPMQAPEISVVLSRLKDRKEIIETRPGSGRKPAVFRHPGPVAAEKLDAAA